MPADLGQKLRETMINIEYKVLQMKPLGTRKNPSPRWDSNPRPSIEGADEMQALRETWMTREEHLKLLCHVFHSSLAPRVYFARSLIFFSRNTRVLA